MADTGKNPQTRRGATTSSASVEAARPEVKPASRVVVAPVDEAVSFAPDDEALRKALLNRAVAAGDLVGPPRAKRSSGKRAREADEMRLTVVSTSPAGVVRIGEATEIEVQAAAEASRRERKIHRYDDLGLLGPARAQVRELIQLPLVRPELFDRLGVDVPRGVLVQTPPSPGRSDLARAVADEIGATLVIAKGSELAGSAPEEAERKLREAFAQAAANQPAIVLIPEIELIAHRREDFDTEGERRLDALLLSLIDAIEPGQRIVVVGVTSRAEWLDPALRWPRRLDRELMIGAPDQAARREILAIALRDTPLADNVDLDELARVTSGYSTTDLTALIREAAMLALGASMSRDEAEDTRALDNLRVDRASFMEALKRVGPSALHDIMIETPTTTWDDVGGLPRIRDRMRDSVVLPLKSPEAVAKMGVKPPSGFLLFGPPGAGKTLVCKATASEAGATLLATTVSELLTQEGGEVARIKRLFARARQATPAVVVIDEIDRLGFPQGDMTDPGAPRRALNTLLAELDAMCETPGLAVIGLTSRPTLLDTALLRSGRLEELIYVPPPDREGRREILTVLTRNMPLAADVNLDALADDTDRYTGADLCELVRRAGLLAARNPDQKEVPAACLTKARDEIGPSVTSEMERAYETVAATLKQEPPRRQGIGFALPGQTG